MRQLTRFEIVGSPPPWSVTGVDKFVVSSLQRTEREGGQLPKRFGMTMCPWGERNAIGGTRAATQTVTDPRLRVVHFTGCSRPYLIVFFVGEHAARQQQLAMRHMPWSEHYAVEIDDEGVIHLRFLACTEEPEQESIENQNIRSLQDLFHAGELVDF